MRDYDDSENLQRCKYSLQVVIVLNRMSLLTVVLLVVYLYTTHYLNDNGIVEYTTFSRPLKFNPNYLGMLCAVVVARLFSLMLASDGIGRVLYLIGASITVAGLASLTSRMAILALLTTICAMIIYHWWTTKVSWPALVVGCLIGVGCLVMASGNLGRVRMNNLKSKATYVIDQRGVKDARWTILESTVDVIRQAPWLGHGSSWRFALDQQFVRHNAIYPLVQRYNTHNQFLQWWVFGGVMLPLLLLVVLWLPTMIDSQWWSYSYIVTACFVTDTPLVDARIAAYISIYAIMIICLALSSRRDRISLGC